MKDLKTIFYVMWYISNPSQPMLLGILYIFQMSPLWLYSTYYPTCPECSYLSEPGEIHLVPRECSKITGMTYSLCMPVGSRLYADLAGYCACDNHLPLYPQDFSVISLRPDLMFGWPRYCVFPNDCGNWRPTSYSTELCYLFTDIRKIVLGCLMLLDW